MKLFSKRLSSLLLLLFTGTILLTAQDFKYESAQNDPLHARIYTLSNGLKVYISVYKDAPRLYTAIAVRAGSKSDPADNTGLAHYLEHMMFKGTDKYGSLDYQKEKPLLDKIDDLFETYRNTKDEDQRKKIYHQIDSVSGLAAKFAIANEYDKMLASIGAKGTNAFTSNEQTVYVNDIPSNQLEKWLSIEGERFRNPVFRIFHTELEAVYEEKNIGLDNDQEKMWDALNAGLFKKHPYGTQTTIGTIDHLKNPSLVRIKEYYHKYYIPNNIAICISGDVDPDATIKLINEKFGSLPGRQLTPFVPPVENAITAPVVKDVNGPDAESMMMGFRFAGATSQDALMIQLVDKILYNGTAGLIDLNLVQAQKVLSAWSYANIMQDYSEHVMGAEPKEGQTLVQLKDLILAQIEKVKKGEFPDWLLTAIVNNMKLEQTKQYESNYARCMSMVDAFVLGQKWQDKVNDIDQLAKITKNQLMDFVKLNYTNNYAVVYKHTGEDKDVKKVIKPVITPVEVNRDSQSVFLKSIVSTKVKEIEPVFLDFNKDIQQVKVKGNIPLYCTLNSENKTFNLYYITEMGNNSDKKIGVAINYLQYLGTSDRTPDEVKQEFYKLACSFDVFNSADKVYVSLSGLSDNFDAAVTLFEKLLADPKPNPEALTNLVSDIKKKRTDAKLDKETILWEGMQNYGMYGASSPFTNILTNDELNALKPEELCEMIKKLNGYQHHILYYGPVNANDVAITLGTLHKTPFTLSPVPAPKVFEELPNTANTVYVINYDMKQAEILMLSRGDVYDPKLAPQIKMYNEYFGGGMASIVFQDLRESKALAYSTFSNFRTPERKDRHFYNSAYIGTQADKLPEAMKGMTELLNEMPSADNVFNASKDAVLQNYRTSRVTRTNILWNFEGARMLGLDHDIRKDIYDKVTRMSIAEVKAFQQKYIKGHFYNILILGDKNALDMKTLEKYGTVKMLTLEDIFGY